MKQKLQLFLLIPIFLLGLNSIYAQRIDYTNDSGWDIGFGLGGSYQQSDIRNVSGGGFTFLIGHSIYQKQNAFWSLDWRLRFLGGQNTAFDDRITEDDIYENIRYTHFNYDLEFVLTMNRLREQTGIILSATGGAGVTHNMTSFDLNDNGVEYDYSVINNDDSRSKKYNDLKELSDYDFETKGINDACITPTVGFYLGYQFTPHFSMGIEHKTNYFLEETHDIVGANIDGKVKTSSHNDKNHYTGLLLKWDIGLGKTPIPCYEPVVNFMVKESNSQYASHQLDGTITNVDNSANISIEINGEPNHNFSFNPNTNTINTAFNLLPGTHKITVSAYNNCGQDSHSLDVFVKEPCFPPEVELSVSEIDEINYSHLINANFTNVSNKEDVYLTIDGIVDNSFEYVPGEFSVSEKYKFEPGSHIILISVKNDCGSDSKSVEIEIDAPCELPIIEFSVLETEINNLTSKIENVPYQLNGTIKNINTKNDISILVDGKPNANFNFYQ